MNILIIGSGGREHAFAWKIAQSPLCDKLYIAPGNAGTMTYGENIPIAVSDIDGIKKFCLDNNIDLVLVGPEAPLVDGITDVFRQSDTSHIGIVGPSAYAAQLEGSKSFAKRFMHRHDIPTAGYLEVTQDNIEEGHRFLEGLKAPYVLKADGLAAGKGVLILDDLHDAKLQLESMLSGKFGKASETVVIEEFLDGIEFSVFALTDGKNYVLLPEAKDYKRIGEGDTGPNTGGMGAISPVPFITPSLWEKVITKVVNPTIDGLDKEKMDYTGFVFFGLINVGGEPYVIEYNCRMGDPENDMVEMLTAAVDGKLEDYVLHFAKESAATVMMVSGGYPDDFEKGKIISGLENVENSIVFHAGTQHDNGTILTNGGRVLAITSMDVDFRKAVQKCLHSTNLIHFDNAYFRKDIGFDL